MSNKLLVDAGENYEYLRTITDNKIELAKINISEKAARMFGSIILMVCLSIVALMIFATLLLVLALYLSQLLGSLILGVLCTSVIMIIAGLVIYMARKQLIYKPVTQFIFDNILDED